MPRANALARDFRLLADSTRGPTGTLFRTSTAAFPQLRLSYGQGTRDNLEIEGMRSRKEV